jgi:parallel beta-helix repeat protein
LAAGVAVALFVASAACAATTYYVDAAAAPGGNGSPGSPFRLIQDAIAAAAGGDTVIVMPGTYNEHLDFLGKGITVQSTDPMDSGVVAATIVDGTASGTVVSFVSGEGAEAVLDGFTIRNGRWADTSASRGGGIHIQDASPTILDNVISSNYTKTDGGGIAVVGNSAPTIEGNTISGNTAEGWGGGIFAYGDASDPENVLPAAPVIHANRISGNHADWDGGGVACFEACTGILRNNVIDANTSGEVGGGIFIGYGVAATVENNTLVANQAQGTSVTDPSGQLTRVGRGGGVACWFSGSTTVDSIIAWSNTAKNNEGPHASLEGSSAMTVRYSDVQGGQSAVFKEAAGTLTWQSGNLAINPLFAPTPGDYHLLSFQGRYDPATGAWVQDDDMSPCIDAGNPALAYDKEPLPNGGRVNMGAYGNTPQASMSGFPFDAGVVVDWTWVYQNTPVTTQDRHKIVATVSAFGDYNGNTSYSVVVSKASGPGDVTPQATANPMVWNLLGGRRGVGGLGAANMQFYVAGNVGGAGVATTTVNVLPLGDMDGNGLVNAMDKLQMNKRLNSVPTGLPERAFDLDGDGLVNAMDKLQMNRILNSVPLP